MGSFFQRLGLVWLLFIGHSVAAQETNSNLANHEMMVQISDGKEVHQFLVEVADDPAERSRGLMYREYLPENHGMLFIYEHSQKASFWMKNTFIPLDMIFIRNDGVVTQVETDAVPGSLTPIRSEEFVRAVLEINAGLSEKYGIEPGDKIALFKSVPQNTAPQ